MLELIMLTILISLFFDFLNGFHDSANAISTVIATKVLTPLQAVGMAAVGNLIGPLFFSTAVAATIGKGIIDTAEIQRVLPMQDFVVMILAAVVGSIAWDVITWWRGLPTSSSHALIGGLVGASLAAVGGNYIVLAGLGKVVAFMIVSPLLGFVAAFAFAALVIRLIRRADPHKINRHSRRIQLFSAFFYSVNHGTNDAQKTMGVITVLLVAGGALSTFSVPIWVILAAQISIALGTFLGGWRIVKTMAHRITDLKPYQGFCAETAGGVVLANMASLGIPVSTTHAITASIMGVGATHNSRTVRWGVARNIITAWVLTIPASAIVAAISFYILHIFI